MHKAAPETRTQQADAATKRWLRLGPDERREQTEPLREGRRQAYRDQLPPGLDHDEVERRVDEFIRIEMRTMARRRWAAERKAKELAAREADLEGDLTDSPAGAA